jgi:pimeloyl-ACP methyl ester carboxylesterase
MSETPLWFEQGIAEPGTPGTVEVDGATIHYETWGEKSKPGIILIHGSNAHRHWWRFVAPFLADQFCVAALDLSGNGDSGHRERYDGKTFAAEVWAVCQQALGPRPFVIGHSFGGFVALETAHHYGSEMSGVIFNDFTVRAPKEYIEWGMRAKREGRTKPRQLRVYPELDTALGRFRLMPEQPVRYPEVVRWLGQHSLKEVDGGWTWKFDPGLFDHLEMGRQQFEKFAGLQCPSAVVLGEYSTDGGAQSAPFMREATGGLLPIFSIPNTHHHMMFEDPMALTMAFKGLVLSWIAQSRQNELQEALTKSVKAQAG